MSATLDNTQALRFSGEAATAADDLVQRLEQLNAIGASLSAERFQNEVTRAQLAGADMRQYDCLLEENRFAALPYGCIIPVPLAFAYALALCVAGSARRIFLVGFDGFHADDSRQAEMLHLLRVVQPHCAGIEITALTPTNYPVRQGSVYASYK